MTNSAAAPAPYHPLRDSRFRRLWGASAVSLFGDQFYLVALPWVVFQLTGSAVAMATIMMAAAIPRAVKRFARRADKTDIGKFPLKFRDDGAFVFRRAAVHHQNFAAVKDRLAGKIFQTGPNEFFGLEG